MKNKRRKTTQEKLAIIAEAKEKGWVETARKYGISYPTLQDWNRRLESGGESVLSGNATVSVAEYKKLIIENQRLKELVADKELEIKINAELLKKKAFLKLTGR
jgi:transposase-like protein